MWFFLALSIAQLSGFPASSPSCYGQSSDCECSKRISLQCVISIQDVGRAHISVVQAQQLNKHNMQLVVIANVATSFRIFLAKTAAS